MIILTILSKIAIAYLSFLSIVRLTEIVVPWYLREQVATGVLVFWFTSLVALELIWFTFNKNPFPRFLTHLRYGPIATSAFFVLILLTFDFAMVQYSKYQIRSYVHREASADTDPELRLHNTDRGWCGNGLSASLYGLYGDTAAEGFSSPDPAVRARSVRMSRRVYDWLNGTCDGPFPALIRKAQTDEDPSIRMMAEEFLDGRPNFCRLSRHL